MLHQRNAGTVYLAVYSTPDGPCGPLMRFPLDLSIVDPARLESVSPRLHHDRSSVRSF